MTRPEGKTGDTGLMWAGWHRSAAESLMWASRDDDPRCVVVSAEESIECGQEALRQAKNQRQIDMTNELMAAATKTLDRANHFLESGVMGDDL